MTRPVIARSLKVFGCADPYTWWAREQRYGPLATKELNEKLFDTRQLLDLNDFLPDERHIPVELCEVIMANTKSIKLVVSEKEPEAVSHGHKVHVDLVDEHLKTARPIAARLCGGTSTCIAVMETE